MSKTAKPKLNIGDSVVKKKPWGTTLPMSKRYGIVEDVMLKDNRNGRTHKYYTVKWTSGQRSLHGSNVLIRIDPLPPSSPV
jgi:hypothetical protein|tara:strand:- start:23 stop:265 length:243 start_codon:yes stop_codon:yes gene_type:complete